MLIVLAAIVMLAGLACIGAAAISTSSDKGYGILGGMGITTVGILLAVGSCIRVVPANTVAIPTTFGKPRAAMSPGLHFVNPFTKVNGFSTRIQTSSRIAGNEGDKADKDDCVSVAASDGAVLCIDATLRYAVDAGSDAKVRTLFKSYGSFEKVRDVLVRRETEEALQIVYGKFTPEQAVSGELAGEIASLAKNALVERFDKYGLKMNSITIGRVHVDQAVQLRIDAKIQARQDAERAVIEQTKAVTQAETKQKEAEIAAKAVVSKATGDAEAARIRASGEADANRTLAASLTPALLQRLYYEALANAKQLVVSGDAELLVTP